ncbi:MULTISPECIES: hypothetical protein [unclassified Pseudomonas]|uniref:hypothetical protein n=1 Tax=unclassified Pseudomonas TaxID=196821 RepID=UPI00244B90D9|nr:MULTISPECIES: hypothetical protein [unclassified Pseudomonas]MDG9925467.1 Lar family restriction alleviation protein [Pseudomonas sp. GD04045]MDH0034092.1 Lar family restriction alleviation protein [Pseudomonas sp. GD04019]
MITPRLLPCPCCGGTAHFIRLECGGQIIECAEKQCVSSGVVRYACGDDPRPLLAEAWNSRRPTAHAQLDVLRQVEQMAAYYEAPKGFFHWLDLQITQRGGTVSATQPAGFSLAPTLPEQQEGRA